MKTTDELGDRVQRSLEHTQSSYDLKFVPLEELSEGGWYRELPDAQLEVMSHARLQRVPLGNADPEQKAREVVADIVKNQKP